MYVIAVLVVFREERVALDLYYLPPELPRALLAWAPCCRDVLHRVHMLRVRGLLTVLSGLMDVQRQLEAVTARGPAHPRVLMRYLDPILLHDACTLYTALTAPAVGGKAWTSLKEPCACGRNEWGFSCTPPRFSGGRLRRDAYDECIAFCWWCMAHRPRVTLLDVVDGWIRDASTDR